MKRTYLLLFFLLLCVQVSAQYTYTANGVTWKFTVIGSNATIVGETQGPSSFSGALNIPSTVSDGTNTYTVTAIGNGAFGLYTGATSLTLPSGLTSIGYFAFSGCSGFTGSLTIPSNVTTIGTYAFYNCSGFTGSLTIPSGVTTIENNTFNGCSGFTGSLTIPSNVTTIGSGTFADCSGFTGALTIPKNVTSIGNGAFYSCSGLESVTFENGSAYTYATGNDQVWGSCLSLKYIDMSGVASPVAATLVERGAYPTASPFADLQPYTMVYLPAGSTAATSGEENFVIGGTCDNFVVYDYHNYYKSGAVGCDYPIQHNFTATTATYMNRDFTGTTCKTVCLPYPATLPTGMRAYELTKRLDSEYYRFTSISGNQLSANVPYLIRITDGASHTFGTDNNVSVLATPSSGIETAASNDATSFFGGTMENIDNTTAAGMNIYNLSNDTWMPIKTDNTSGYVHSFRAYVRTTGSFPANGFALVLDENPTTGIDEMEQDVEQGAGEIFTLGGRSAGHDLNSLKSGEVYIKNGKKFYKF